MKNLLVLIPGTIFVKYFVYSLSGENYIDYLSEEYREGLLPENNERKYHMLANGKINLRGPLGARNDIKNLLEIYKPESIAIKVLYGGKFLKMQLFIIKKSDKS